MNKVITRTVFKPFKPSPLSAILATVEDRAARVIDATLEQPALLETLKTLIAGDAATAIQVAAAINISAASVRRPLKLLDLDITNNLGSGARAFPATQHNVKIIIQRLLELGVDADDILLECGFLSELEFGERLATLEN